MNASVLGALAMALASGRIRVVDLTQTLTPDFPQIAQLWQRHWERIAPAFAYPLPVRRLLYSTNAIESLHMQLRRALKIRGHFPNDDAASKLLCLALRNAAVKLGPPKDWRTAMEHISLLFGDRVPAVE